MTKAIKKILALSLSLAMLLSFTGINAGQVEANVVAAELKTESSAPTVLDFAHSVSSFEEAAKILQAQDPGQDKAFELESAELGKNTDGVLTQCGGDCAHAPSIIIPGIGQSDVFLLDENNERAKDKDGKDINAFPLLIDIEYLFLLIVPMVKMLVTQKDNGFTDLAAKILKKSLAKTQIDDKGQPVSNLEVKTYPSSVATCTPKERERVFNTIPISSYSDIVGEDHLYFFTYNSFGNNLDETENLYNFIQTVKRETGHDKINIVPISLGSTLAVSLFENYPQVSDDLNKVVFIVPAIDGSCLVGDLYKGQLSTDDESLYKTMLPELLGADDYTGYLINILIRIIPKQILHDLLDKVLGVLNDILVRNCTMIWGLVPSADYEEAAQKLFADGQSPLVKAQTENYYQAQLNAHDNILKLVEDGVQVFNVVDYNHPIYPFVPSSKNNNGDGLIHFDSESMGATAGYVDSPLPSDYTPKNPRCTDPSHNHISPDGIVDASTGLLPETTFYFYNQDHEGTGRNDVIMKLATELLAYDNLQDVHSMPNRFPQFNVGRETKGLMNDRLPKAKQVDQSLLAPEDAAQLQAAIERAEAMLADTVVDYQEFLAAENDLNQALIQIGLRNPPEDKKFEKYAQAVLKFVSDVLYQYWGPRGYSDKRGA
ncbi:MAG: hypothetical protein GX345_05730 [Clostridiales bacterium]|nr:hypothetical protein [Clostridiales bacterium]